MNSPESLLEKKSEESLRESKVKEKEKHFWRGCEELGAAGEHVWVCVDATRLHHYGRAALH